MVKGKKVYIECFKGVDLGAALAQSMGAGVAGGDGNEALHKQLAGLFEGKGYVVVDTPEEADYAYLHVWPCSNGMVFYQYAMPVIEMVDNQLFEERESNKSQKKTGKIVPITTLKDVDKIKTIKFAHLQMMYQVTTKTSIR